jgi:hypothetical protein
MIVRKGVSSAKAANLDAFTLQKRDNIVGITDALSWGTVENKSRTRLLVV